MDVRTVRRGAGEPYVLIHGIGSRAEVWSPVLDALAERFAVVAVDLPGFGRSPAQVQRPTIERQTDALAQWLRDEGLEGCHVGGNSMGGAIALLVAAQRPELVKTLTLISPAVPDLRLDPRRLSDPRMAFAYLPLVGARVRAQLAALGPRERAAQVIKLCFADPSRFPESRLDELTEEHGARAGFAWAAPAMARSTFAIFRAWSTRGKASLWSVAPLVKAPTLVVWGREDRVISVKRAVRTARAIPRARLLVLPRTGHVAQMERPVVVAKAVLGMWEHVEAGTW